MISYGIDEGEMLGYIMWTAITKPESEISKAGNLIGLKDNIIDGDILWATLGSLELIFDGTEEGHNYEYSWLGIFEWYADGVKQRPLIALHNNFRQMMNKYDLAYLNELLKEI